MGPDIGKGMMMNEGNREEASPGAVPAHIHEMLRPLESIASPNAHPGTPSMYQRQQRELLDMNSRFRGAEALLADAYAQVSTLEKAIAGYRQKWQNSAP